MDTTHHLEKLCQHQEQSQVNLTGKHTMPSEKRNQIIEIFLYLPLPLSAPASLASLTSPFLLLIPPLTPPLSPTPPSYQQFGRLSPKQASGTLHFQSLKEARAQSLLYHKLEHEKLIHFIHLSDGEREGKKSLLPGSS